MGSWVANDRLEIDFSLADEPDGAKGKRYAVRKY
jgi:hypothetical protein